MRRPLIFATVLLSLLVTGCLSSGPQKGLNALAEAMQKNDSAAFLAQIDMKAFAANAVKTMTREDRALSTLDALGRKLGLGGMENLLGNVMDVERNLRADFSRGVSTGELMLRCRKADTPDCPWTPEALKHARVKDVGQDAAIAQVTTQARMTSWLALRKQGEDWRVVGQAIMEDEAREYATRSGAAVQPQPGKKNTEEGTTNL
ncbi:MAG: hypothetical protein IJU37_11195 [Desulfovibrio sp.]|nr:hypothetical protein [Desulfovibrio sp.]